MVWQVKLTENGLFRSSKDYITVASKSERIAALQAKLQARESNLAYGENRKAIQKELERLKALPGDY